MERLSKRIRLVLALAVPSAFWPAALPARGVTITVIYSEVDGTTGEIVPGALDALGEPIFATFQTISELAVRHDGGQWMVKGRSDLDATLDNFLILGSGTEGAMFCQ